MEERGGEEKGGEERGEGGEGRGRGGRGRRRRGGRASLNGRTHACVHQAYTHVHHTLHTSHFMYLRHILRNDTIQLIL